MKTFLTITLTLILLSCSQTKSASATASSSTTEVSSSEDMLAQGYIMGVIKTGATDGGCEYTIDTKKFNYHLDPTNLDDAFKKDGLKVWFTHRGLRMMNRCPEATPIEVIEMKVRKE